MEAVNTLLEQLELRNEKFFQLQFLVVSKGGEERDPWNVDNTHYTNPPVV